MSQARAEPKKIGTITNRIIDCIKGKQKGPTLIFFAGIHGNEPAGVLGLQQVFQELRKKKFPIVGAIYGLAGNLNALQKQIRYQDEDLNRIWDKERIKKINALNRSQLHQEEKEMSDLYQVLSELLKAAKPPFYFIDLHTTSGKTAPFIVMNDSLLNRRFVRNYPLPKVLGIEEYLHGALLSFINEMGYVSFGFESGQHDEPNAITNNISFIHYTLILTTSIKANSEWIGTVKKQMDEMLSIPSAFFEITYEHHLKASDNFEMEPGFLNFQEVRKGRKVATFNNKEIVAESTRQIFMPLYQTQGSEGFYFIKPIPKVFLWISKYLRKVKLDNFLTLLPGVNWQSREQDALLVDTRVAKYISKSLFHLMGYRVRKGKGTNLILKSRESASKHLEYPNSWK